VEVKTLKKVISGTVSAMMIAASVPFSASAAVGNIDLGSISGGKVEGGFGGFGGGMNWGGNGGGQDWSGFAGGFNGGGADIGSDAGSGGNAQSGLNAKIKLSALILRYTSTTSIMITWSLISQRYLE